jgi:hypothetical protein
MHFLRAIMQRGALLVFYSRGFAAVDSPHIKGKGSYQPFPSYNSVLQRLSRYFFEFERQVNHQKWSSALPNFLLQSFDEQDGFCQYRRRC